MKKAKAAVPRGTPVVKPEEEAVPVEKPKHPGGRPTIYKSEYCQQLIEHMANGRPYETFAYRIGVGRSSMYEWEAKFPEFADAKQRGREASYDWWMTLYQGAAMGAQGMKDANPTLIIFAMKNMHGWRDRTEIEAKFRTEERKAAERVAGIFENGAVLTALDAALKGNPGEGDGGQ